MVGKFTKIGEQTAPKSVGTGGVKITPKQNNIVTLNELQNKSSGDEMKQPVQNIEPTANTLPADRIALNTAKSELKTIEENLPSSYVGVNFSKDGELEKFIQQQKDYAKAKQEVFDLTRNVEDKTLGERVDLSLRSLLATTPLSLPVIKEVSQQAAKNERNPDVVALRADKADVDRQIQNFSFSNGAQSVDQYRALLEQSNALEQEIKNKTSVAADINSPAMRAYADARQLGQDALSGLSSTEQFLGNTLYSIGQNAMLLPLSAINPALTLGAMGTISAANRAYDLSAQGVGAGEAFNRGLISGGIEALTEKLPLDNLLDIIKSSGGKSFLSNLLKQAGIEASEEAASYVLNYAVDEAAKDPNARFSLSELAQNALGGAISGGVFGGFGSAVNAAARRLGGDVVLLPSSRGQQNTAATKESGNTKLTNSDLTEYLKVGDRQHVRNVKEAQLKSGDSPILTTVKQIRDFITSAIQGKTRNVIKAYGRVGSKMSADIARAAKTDYGIGDITGYYLELDANRLGHLSDHIADDGDPRNIPLSESQVLNLTDYIDNYDDILDVVKKKDGSVRVIVGKQVDNGHVIIIELISKGRQSLQPVTAWQNTTEHYQKKYGKKMRINTSQPTAYTEKPSGYKPASFNQTLPQSAGGVNPEYAPGSKNDTRYPGPDESVGAAPAGFSGAYGQLQGQSTQFHKPGENPRPDRLVDVPTKDFEGRNIPKSVATVMEAKATPDSAVGIIEDAIAKGEFSFDTITDEAANQRASQTINEKGWDGAKEQFHQDAKRGVISKDNIALGQVLLNNAMNAGDSKAVIDILTDYASMSTTSAQALQAQRILKKLSPEGKLYGIQKSIQSIQEELIQKYKDKAPNIQLDETLTQDFLNAKTEAERSAAEKAIYKNIAKQIPATFADKWNAWRYLSMLGNPRTHVRNIVGNLGFAPVRMVKDAIATGLEFTVDKASKNGIQRTKSVLNPGSKADRALIVEAWNDVSNVEDQLLGGGKFNDTPVGKVERERTIFKTLPLEALRKANSAAMDFEDTLFSKPTYAAALAGYLKANGVTADALKNNSVDSKLLNNARSYAILEAQKATYRDSNELSDFISRLRYRGNNNVGKAVNVLTEGTLPFRRTPANILMRGIEYSPIGLAKSLTSDLAQVKSGNMTAAQAIDNISAGLTGTGLVALGAFLAAQGLISGGSSGDDEQSNQNDLTGGQPYALSIGGKNYTLDWLAPEALPLFVGVELQNLNLDKGDGRFSDNLLQAISTISEPMLEMSMLQSLQDLLDSIEYSDNKLFGMLSTSVINHLTQGVPTLLGQIERTGEDRRETTFIDRTSPLTNDLQYTIGRVANKIPFLEFQQIPYIDAWGREESTGNLASRAFNNFLNPAYASTEVITEADEELQRLYDAGQAGVFPQRVSQSQKIDGEYLSAEDYQIYATERGQTSLQMVESVIGTKLYQGASDEEKADAVKLSYDYANAVARQAIDPEYEPSSWIQSLEDVPEQSRATYIAFRATMDRYNEDQKNSLTIAETKNAIDASGVSDEQKEFLWLMEYPDWVEQAEKRNAPISDYIQYKSITAGASKKADKLQALLNSGMTILEANRLYNLCN